MFPARSLRFTIFGDIFAYPTIEIVTFLLHGWFQAPHLCRPAHALTPSCPYACRRLDMHAKDPSSCRCMML